MRGLDEDGARIVAAVLSLPSGSTLTWNALAEGPSAQVVWSDPIWCPEVCERLDWRWSWVLDEPDGTMATAGMELEVLPDDQVDGAPVWHEDTVTRALGQWISRWAGRVDLEVTRDRDLRWPIDDWLSPVSHLAPGDLA